jgi:sensor histidine kinase YesM
MKSLLRISYPAKIEKIFPIILVILMPGLSLLNDNSFIKQFTTLKLIQTWLSTSFILIIIWYVNEWLSKRNLKAFYLIAFTLNTAIVTLLIIFISLLSPDSFTNSMQLSWIRGLRMMFASVIFIAIQQSFKSAKTVEKLKTENLSLKAENYKAELDQLRKQVDPHFLFNSLSTLQTMIRNSNPNSEIFLSNLSSLYRQILQTYKHDNIPLKEELTFLESYIYLMKMRHEDALKISFDINPKSLRYSIPIFALQTLVENCIKHNIVSISKPLQIRIYQKDNATISVSNNYQPKIQALKSNGVGLNNLSERYKLMNIVSGLDIEKTSSHYTVTIKLI